MQTLSIRRTIPKSLIAEAFGLSYVEAHLALLLSQGFTMESAADTLGIKVSTARSYSKNIYVKLGISRQVDLVRKVLRSVALLA
jgi:DNA-binding CsgD family transcriptional regulator